MRTAFTLALSAACLLSAPCPAQAQPPAPTWRLLVFHAFRPGLLSRCENAHLHPDFQRHALPEAADPLKARWLTEAAIMQWSGGRFSQPATGEVPASPRLLTDACFTLFVNGAPVVSGGVVSSRSARRFDFPALVVDGTPSTDAPLRLTLAPRFPVRRGEPVPAGWPVPLQGLNDADVAPEQTSASVCPPRAGTSPSQIDVFDGDPSERAFLAPDTDRRGVDTYTVKPIYDQGRMVTIRCHYGKESVDVKLTKPVSTCRFSEDGGRPQIVCK